MTKAQRADLTNSLFHEEDKKMYQLSLINKQKGADELNNIKIVEEVNVKSAVIPKKKKFNPAIAQSGLDYLNLRDKPTGMGFDSSKLNAIKKSAPPKKSSAHKKSFAGQNAPGMINPDSRSRGSKKRRTTKRRMTRIEMLKELEDEKALIERQIRLLEKKEKQILTMRLKSSASPETNPSNNQPKKKDGKVKAGQPAGYHREMMTSPPSGVGEHSILSLSKQKNKKKKRKHNLPKRQKMEDNAEYIESSDSSQKEGSDDQLQNNFSPNSKKGEMRKRSSVYRRRKQEEKLRHATNARSRRDLKEMSERGPYEQEDDLVQKKSKKIGRKNKKGSKKRKKKEPEVIGESYEQDNLNVNGIVFSDEGGEQNSSEEGQDNFEENEELRGTDVVQIGDELVLDLQQQKFSKRPKSRKRKAEKRKRGADSNSQKLTELEELNKRNTHKREKFE